jgi:diphthine synthase
MGLRCYHLHQLALSTLKRSDRIFVDTYTSIYQEDPIECLKGKGIDAKPVGREFLESEQPIEMATNEIISIAVIGHPLVATTHNAIILEASKKGIKWKIIDNMSAIEVAKAKSGLSYYRFGKMTTVMYPRDGISFMESVKLTIEKNDKSNLHTMLLLETGYDRTMRANEAASIILDEMPELSDRLVVVMARLSWDDELITVMTMEEVRKSEFGDPPHLLVLPSPKLHPLEEEAGMRRIISPQLVDFP